MSGRRAGRVLSAVVAFIAGVVCFMWGTPSAYAICASGSQSIESADSVFEAMALPGPTAPNGALLSPARFEVIEWIKGDGPSVVEVETAVSQQGEFVVVVSEGIAPEPGQRWVVMLEDGSAACTGSRPLEEGEQAPPAPSSRFSPLTAPVVIGVVVVVITAWLWRRHRDPSAAHEAPAASG